MKELTKKCIGLISKSLIELGQTKTDKDILILATTLADDLIRDFSKMSFEDIEEAFRNGIRQTDLFSLNVKTYYKWIKHQKKIIYDDLWNKNNFATYREDKRIVYRSRKGTGLNKINIKQIK
tara:strand:+ start:2601 stop:2966 length:366 start_codon:yes stop_codon:yes gene_type:complete